MSVFGRSLFSATNMISDLFVFSCNSNSKAPSAIRVCIAGSDSYVNTILRPYVEQFSAKPPDWQTYIKFLIIPFGESMLSCRDIGVGRFMLKKKKNMYILNNIKFRQLRVTLEIWYDEGISV
jgi:hypothetical protein